MTTVEARQDEIDARWNELNEARVVMDAIERLETCGNKTTATALKAMFGDAALS